MCNYSQVSGTERISLMFSRHQIHIFPNGSGKLFTPKDLSWVEMFHLAQTLINFSTIAFPIALLLSTSTHFLIYLLGQEYC